MTEHNHWYKSIHQKRKKKGNRTVKINSNPVDFYNMKTSFKYHCDIQEIIQQKD